MNRIVAILAVIALLAGVLWRFPLFHVVPLEQAQTQRSKEAFNARAFAERFWQSELAGHFDQAADAATVLAALRDNPQQARERFGRQVGVSRTTYFFLRGGGAIVTVDRKGVAVSINADVNAPEVLLSTGPVFGNAVRDATGLLESADFPNSQHFNELPNELNRLAEAGPIERLKAGAAPGRRVQFVGCTSITGDKFAPPLKIIPVDVTIE